jgi:peptide/nickel transport system substrate-binding protein
MSLRKSFPLCLLTVMGGCADAPKGAPTAAADSFCGPALARVEAFMSSFHGPPPEGERYGGTVVAATVSELEVGMNGFAPIETGASQHQMFVNLMTLVQYDEDLEPVPYLAKSWEISRDLTELTFTLRDDVFWHDGEPTTARDVAFTFRRASDPETGFPNPGFFRHYLPGEGGVEVLDDFTVRFHFTRPHAEFMDPWRAVAVMPEHLLGDVPPSELAQHPFGTLCPVGNGPFRFLDHLPGDRWVFEANPWFPRELGGRPYLDRYVYRTIPENSTLQAELLTGGIDVYVSVTPESAERIRGEDHLELRSYPSRSVLFAGWNSRVSELSDPVVRRALTLGTNRRQILEGVRYGWGDVANTGVPPTHWAYDPSLEDSLSYDPAGARRLLQAAGWSDRDGDGIRENAEGEPLTIELIVNPNQERREVAEIMQAQLREVGVALQPRVVEMAVLVSRVASPERDFQGVLLSWEGEFRLDDRDLFHSEAADVGGYGFSGIQDAELDRYLDTLQLIPTREEAGPVWQAYQARLLRLQPFTYLYAYHRQNGLNRRLENVTMDVRGDWQNIREWWISSGEGRAP